MKSPVFILVLLILATSLTSKSPPPASLSGNLTIFFKSLKSFIPIMFSTISKNGFYPTNSNSLKPDRPGFLPISLLDRTVQQNLDIFNPLPDVLNPSSSSMYFRELMGLFKHMDHLARRMMSRQIKERNLSSKKGKNSLRDFSRLNISILQGIFSKSTKKMKKFREEFKSGINQNPAALLKVIRSPSKESLVVSMVLKGFYLKRDLFFNITCFDEPKTHFFSSPMETPKLLKHERVLTKHFNFRRLFSKNSIKIGKSILDVHLKNTKVVSENKSRLFCGSKKMMRFQVSWNKDLFENFFNQFELFAKREYVYVGHLSKDAVSALLGEFGHLLIQSEFNKRRKRDKKFKSARVTGTNYFFGDLWVYNTNDRKQSTPGKGVERK